MVGVVEGLRGCTLTVKKVRQYRKMIRQPEYVERAIDCIADTIAQAWIDEKYHKQINVKKNDICVEEI